MANNVDIAIMELRQFQQMIFDRKVSPDDLFQKTNAIIETMNKASAEINQNYEDISRKLTAQMNTGIIQKSDD